MPNSFCQEHRAHEQSLQAHGKRLDAHGERLDEEREERKQMEVMMQRLIDLSEYAQQRIDQHALDLKRPEDRINALEDRPAADAERIKNAALGSIGGALGTAIMVAILLAMNQTIT